MRRQYLAQAGVEAGTGVVATMYGLLHNVVRAVHALRTGH
jgi:hypothetical protein